MLRGHAACLCAALAACHSLGARAEQLGGHEGKYYFQKVAAEEPNRTRYDPKAVPEEAANCFGVTGLANVDNPQTVADSVYFLPSIWSWLERGLPTASLEGGAIGMLAAPSMHMLLYDGGSIPEMSPLCAAAMACLAFVASGVHGMLDVLIHRPWEDLLRTPWPLFELWAASPRLGQSHPDAFWRCCADEEEASFWRQESAQAVGAALRAGLSDRELLPSALRMGIATVLRYISAQEANTGIFRLLPEGDRRSVCIRLRWQALLMMMAMLDDPVVPPGYAIRNLQALTQRIFVSTGEARIDLVELEDLAEAPWPLLSLLVELAARERAMFADLETTSVSAGSSGAQAAESAAFSPLSQQAASHLEATMQVAHNFLTAMGMPYILIAGSLLGAVRHLGRIPWDDDIDICVDHIFEPTWITMAMELQARRLGMAGADILSWRTLRALRYLTDQGYELRVVSSRSLTFRIFSRGAPDAFVDVWMCWGFTEATEEVTLMSKKFGPRVPQSLVFPRRKMPFGRLTVWGPREPVEVTHAYLNHSGDAEDFRATCRGRKVHGAKLLSYEDAVPCAALSDTLAFARDWRPLRRGDGAERAHIEMATEAAVQLISQRMPGLEPPSTEDVSVEAAGLGSVDVRWLRLEFPARGARATQSCQALLWRGGRRDAEEPFGVAEVHDDSGMGRVIVRSLTCGDPGEDPAYVWEDASWL